ncbi:MAG: hypothetical protein K9W43_12825 [Candidatus Thorarchaeota archaeon]|nr:hypothetical protein [Candidatus Thorarchaeota archaeon]
MNAKARSIMTVFIVGIILLLLQLPTTHAASTQNLSWGVSVGDQFTYHFKYRDYKYPIYNKSFDIIVNVTGLPDIPEGIASVNSLYYFPIHANVSMYFENGTDLGMISAHLPNMIWPVGNWPLWSNLVHDYLSNEYVFVDDKYDESVATWSCKVTGNRSDTLYTIESYIFDKSTGVLNYLNYTSYLEDGPSFSYYLERFPITNHPSSDGTLLLVAGTGAVILIVVVVLGIRKFK